MNNETLINLVSDIVCAHVARNNVAAGDVPVMIRSVFAALAGVGTPMPQPEAEPLRPAVSIRSSVKSDTLVCLECGGRFKSLKRHLGKSHGLTPDDYRARWKLPSSYPMVSSNYSEVRRQSAVKNNLGRKPGRRQPDKSAPAASSLPRRKLKLSL